MFIRNAELTSQISYTILLADGRNYIACLHWSSTKARTVTKTTLTAECILLRAGVDEASSMQTEVDNLLYQHLLLLIVLIDSRSIFDALVTTKILKDRRLMVDLLEMCNIFKTKDINNVGWIQTQYSVQTLWSSMYEILILYKPRKVKLAHRVRQHLTERHVHCRV